MYDQEAASVREEIPVLEYPKRLASCTETTAQLTERLRVVIDRLGSPEPREANDKVPGSPAGIADQMVAGFQRQRNVMAALEREVMRLEHLIGTETTGPEKLRRVG